MSIVRSESLLDAILTSNSVVLDVNQANNLTETSCSNTNSSSILSPNPTEESIALANRNSHNVDVSSFDALANVKTAKEWNDSSSKHNTQPQRSKRDKIQSFIQFDDDEAGNNKSTQERTGHPGQRSLSNGKSLDYSYCDNIELADVFSIPNSSKNQTNENSQLKNHKLDVDDVQTNDDDVEWEQFQSSQTPKCPEHIDSDSEDISDVIDTENNDDELFEGDESVYTKLQKMEAEQEVLNNSLLALTSHFAKVQFRIKQIVNSGEDMKQEQKEKLLKDLEAFANRGIPELMSTSIRHNSTSGCGSIATSIGKLERTTSMATSLMADDVFDDLETETEDNVDGFVTEEKLEKQRSRQKELIERLKEQLEDLERYAYETGDIADLPSSMLLERQNVIIEQLKSKLPVLTIDEIDKLSPEQLRTKVDKAVRELVSPVLMKEQLVSQLKTQVTDLERFIEFLQKAHGKKLKNGLLDNGIRSKMSHFLKLKRQQEQQQSPSKSSSKKEKINKNSNYSRKEYKNLKILTNSGTKTIQNRTCNSVSNNCKATTPHTNHANIIRRIISLLQVFAWTQIGSSTNFSKYSQSTVPRNYRPPFEKNSLKRQTRHFGDLRAHLEMSIDRLIKFYDEHYEKNNQTEENGDDDGSSSNEDFISLGETKLVINNYFLYDQMNVMIRKDFAVALRNLIQHGLKGAVCDEDCDQSSNGHRASTSISMSNGSGAIQPSTHTSLLALGLGCFGLSGRAPTLNMTSISSARISHAWEVILFYYNLKNGSRLRSDSSRRLSQSFGLQVVTGMNIANPKHSLLVAIDDIIDTHTRLKRSLDAHFKAFVCVALNQKMLSQWLRLIVRNSRIVSECYERWSYASSTGFEDALRQMDKLASLKFCLPTDIAVRQLQSIHDAF